MPRRLVWIALALAGGWLVACATSASGRAAKYPPRRPGCALQVFHTDMPPLAGWDDLGLLEVICHIDETEKTCYGRMRAEACRMGGDVVYHLPLKPWRPKEQVMGFRAKVAHTVPPPAKNDGAKVGHADGDGGSVVDPTFPPPATPEEAAGPVIPLTGPAAPAPDARRDAGSAPPDGR